MHACLLSCFSHVRLFVTLWIVAHQAPLSRGFSRQEHWSRLPCPPPGDLPNPETEPSSLMSPALTGRFFTTSATWEALGGLKSHKYWFITLVSCQPGKQASNLLSKYNTTRYQWREEARKTEISGYFLEIVLSRLNTTKQQKRTRIIGTGRNKAAESWG